MRVVLDTNVLVSGLLNEAGTPGKIIDLALENRFQIAYDDRILGEYEDVLARPELHIRPALSRAVIAHIELSGCQIDAETIVDQRYPDPDDLPFVEVFITAKADALITGNPRHFLPLIESGSPVFTPIQFIDALFHTPE